MGLNVLGVHDSPLHMDLMPLYPDTISPLNSTDDMLFKNFEVAG